MKNHKVPVAISILIGAIIVAVMSQIFWGPDNSVEEAGEQLIKNQTGINIDLSPGTPETHEEETKQIHRFGRCNK